MPITGWKNAIRKCYTLYYQATEGMKICYYALRSIRCQMKRKERNFWK